MASEVGDYRVSKPGLRPRYRDYPNAKAKPQPNERHRRREVPNPNYTRKLKRIMIITTGSTGKDVILDVL